MGLLTKEQLLKKNLPVERVELPELGGEIYVRTLTANERDEYEAQHVAKKEEGNQFENFRGRFAALVVCDEQGNRIFTDEEASLLGEQSAKILDRIFDVGQRLNGMAPEEKEKIKNN